MATQLPVALSVPVQFQDPGPLTSQQLNQNFNQLVVLLEQTNAAVNALAAGGALGFAFNTALSPLVFNFGNYVGTPTPTQAVAMTALQTMLTAMGSPIAPEVIGGYVWIPQNTFPITNTATGLVVPDNSIFQALGPGGKGIGGFPDFFHFTVTDSVSNGVVFNMKGAHGYGGIEWHNVAFSWTGASIWDSVFNVNTTCARFYGCTFTNTPTAIILDGFQCLIKECQYFATTAGVNNATWFILASKQGSIVGPSEFIQTGPASGGPTGNVGIAVGGGFRNSEKMTIERIHLADPNIGIDFADTNGALNNAGISSSGCNHLVIDKVHIQATQSCINLTPASTATNAYINNTKISNCTFLKGQLSAQSSPIVLLDGGTVTSNTVYGVEMVNCDVIGNVNGGTPEANQYGVQISNLIDSVYIDNCRINQVGTPAGSDGTANIAVLGNPGPGTINITNCDLRPIYNSLVTSNAQPFGNSSSGSTASQYAFLIPASATLSNCKIRISNCNMSGFTGSPVSVAGTISGSATLKIKDCRGYNDAATVVTATQPVVGGTGATTAAAQGYYGPSVFSGVNTGSNTTLTWASKTYTLTANQTFSFTVDPYDSMSFSQSITTFRWIGV